MKFRVTGISKSSGEVPAAKTAALLPNCWVKMKPDNFNLGGAESEWEALRSEACTAREAE